MAEFKRTPPDFSPALLPPPPDDFVPQFSKVRSMQAPGSERRGPEIILRHHWFDMAPVEALG